MAIIYNDDKTVGNTRPANRWDLGRNADARYSLYSSKYGYEFKSNGDGTYTYERSRKNEPKSLSDAEVRTKDASFTAFSINGFINKMQQFYFAPPSDNLWTVSIRLHTDSLSARPNTIVSLYDQIIEANRIYDTSNVKSKWGINYAAKVKLDPRNYMEDLADNSRLFLAQTVNFKPYGITVSENVFTPAQSAGGFLTFGKVLQSKTGGNECSISFLISNWDICDILIDPWIAAIAKHGLIEATGIPNLKADIILEEYSSSVPKDMVEGYEYKEMVLRKTYKFIKAFPISRGEVSKNYEYNQAGTFKTSTVQFKFDEYNITYHI